MNIIPICSVFVVNDKNEVLCVKQLYERLEAHCWTLPGGGIDDGETPEQAAIREVKEETGFEVTDEPKQVYEAIVVDGKRKIFHVHGFLFREFKGMATISENDVTDIAFLNPGLARAEMAEIKEEGRLEPIFQVLDDLIAGREPQLYRKRYILDDDRRIIAREDLVGAL